MLQPVVDGNLLIVYLQRAGFDAPLVFLGGMRTKLPCKHVQYFITDPATLGECCKCKKVRINLTQTLTCAYLTIWLIEVKEKFVAYHFLYNTMSLRIFLR